MDTQNIFYDCPENIFFDFNSDDGIAPTYFHFHNHFEISIVLSGKLTVINNGDTVKTDKPCLILHRPNTFHAVIAEKGTKYDRYHIYFNNSFLIDFPVEYLSIRELFHSNFSVTELTKEDVGELMTYLNLIFGANGNLPRQSLLLASFLNKMTDYVGTGKTIEHNANSSYIEDVIKFISENYGEQITASSLADKFYVSSAKLNMDFKAMTSITLHKYIVTVRLINAKRMLIGGVSVLETSIACGFFNESHFIRTFKEKTGVTPSRYAKMFGKEWKNSPDYPVVMIY